MDDDRTAPRLSVGAVAHRLGVAPGTLRTWDRRYGLGPSDHPVGSHRRYTPEDLARLETMQRLVLEGVPPAEAARVALGGPALPQPAAAQPESRTGGPGGRVLPLPGAEAVVRGLARAAMALDSDAVQDIVREQLAKRGVVGCWESVLVPVLVSVGARWEATGEGVEVEHLLSDCIAAALRQHDASTRPVSGPRPVLLACAPDDQHVLPLHALAAALTEQGHGCRVLGAAVPPEALEAALRRTGAGALFLWAQTGRTGDLSVLDAVPATRPATRVVLGGPGWPRALPRSVQWADGLGAALGMLAPALGGEALAFRA